MVHLMIVPCSHLCITRMVDLTRFDQLRANNVGGQLTDGTDYVPLDSMTGSVWKNICKEQGTLEWTRLYN